MRRAILAAMVACAGCEAVPETRAQKSLLTAYCTADVEGVAHDVELDYLPHVVACENGAADQAALEAQAIAARSYLYYRLDLDGTIGDGQGDQVYTCANPPNADHVAAVEATAGQVLQYLATQVAAFYVAGAFQDPPECSGGTDDPTNTERFVTYNEGLAGAQLEQTTLGFVDPSNYANRGCMSQNGADCLSLAGYTADQIIRFYYGADIELVRAEGSCIDAPTPDAGVDPMPGEELGSSCQIGRGENGAVFLLVLLILIRRRR